ncbi:MAG: aminotransferase class III-fold pyridoxal phosphate-dependent enzyme [Deltaproteobacteria bacterium]|nr:aminotransferase class III-fold pyridoxal phosphate-dependent enzyme [Deltaproteobacteria bacterium]
MLGAKSYVFHRRLDYRYPVIKYGKGIYLYDEQGKKYIDAVGGALVATIGHGVNQIAEEVAKLAKRVSYIHGSQFTTRLMEEYAEELCRVAPRGLSKVYFVSGGSEAVETAIKLARQYHYDAGNKSKYKIIFTWPSYHGASIGALSITGKHSTREIQRPFLLDFPHMPSCFCYRCPYGKSYPGCSLRCAVELEKVIKRAKADSIAAFMVEPVIGASAGAVVPPAGYLSVIRDICNKYNILLIFDEIMSGFGRTGKWFASQHWGCVPDITVVGKGLSAGFVSLSAVFCKKKIVETIRKKTGNFIHGFTFANNPLTTGVGRAVLRYLKKNNLVHRCAERGEYLLHKLRTLYKFDIVGDVRGLGLMTAVEFVKDKASKRPFSRNKKVAEKILQAAQKKGLMLYYSIGFVDKVNGDAVMVGPPFIVAEKEIDKIIEIFSQSISEVQKTL